MPLIPTLLVLWPLALISLTLITATILSRWPDRCDDIWRLPRGASSRLSHPR